MIAALITRHLRPRSVTLLSIRPSTITTQPRANFWSPDTTSSTSTSTSTNNSTTATPSSTTATTTTSAQPFSTETKEIKLSRDAIADIIKAEFDSMTIVESQRIVRMVFDTITESITNKQSVSIASFGKFTPVPVPARSYTNPQDPSGPGIMKPATTKVKFTPYKHLKDCVAEGKIVESK